MPRARAPLSPKLLRRLKKLSRLDSGFAEINRLIGSYAEELGELRPSYQCVRTIVHEFRYEAEQPTLGSVALDVAFRARPSSDLLVDQLVLGGARPLPKIRRKKG